MAGHIPDSLSVDWCTEDKYVECVHKTFGGPPDLDPCSNPHSRVGARTSYMLPHSDGLVLPWTGASGFMNPPFGKGWWKLRGCENQVCACMGTCREREYIWPGDRSAKLEALIRQAKEELGTHNKTPEVEKLAESRFKAWAKDYTLVDIGDWIERAAAAGNAMEQGLIGLLPSYPGTRAWPEHVFPKARRIFFPKGRLHFRLVYTQPDGTTIEKTGPAPMDCAFPLWTHNLYIVHAFEQAFGPHGRVVTP
jgi:hypothetical protein